MFIYSFIILFWVTTRISSCALILKKHISFALSLKYCCCSSRLLEPPINTQSALIDQLTLAWPSTANNNRAAVLNQFLCDKLAVRHKLCKCVTLWRSVTSQSHSCKGETTDEAFWGQCSLWERGAPAGVVLLQTPRTFIKKLKEMKRKK